MPVTYVWKDAGAEDTRQAVILTLEAAKAQAEEDATTAGGPEPCHITDQDGVILVAYGKAEEFIPVVANGGGLEPQDPKPLDEVEPDEAGQVVVTQTELTGDDFTAYVESVNA